MTLKELKFSSFNLQNRPLNNNNDPDFNFLNTCQFCDSNYLTIVLRELLKVTFLDHFTIFLITIAQFFNNIRSKKIIRKREINKKSEQYFKGILREVNWKHLDALTDNNLVSEYFLCTYNGLYNHAFPIKEVS